MAQLSDPAGDMVDGRPSPAAPHGRPPLLWLLLFVGFYLLGAGFAQLLAIIPETGISIWPPSGLFVATLLLSPTRLWPWWIAAALVAETAANLLLFHNALPVAVLIFAGNVLEAMAGAWLVGRFCTRPLRLESLREVLALTFLAAGIAPVVSATIGGSALAWSGTQSFLSAWPLFWIGDATGVLVFAPICLASFASWRDLGRFGPGRIAEAVALALVFVGVSVLTLSGSLSFVYIIMPVLLWVAVRFELKGAAVALLLLVLITALFTIGGVSPFAGDPDSMRHRGVMLQLFLAISALAALVVAALAREHHRALATLRATNRDLEGRVEERTASLRDSERRLSGVLEALPIGVALIDRAGRTLVGNAVYERFLPTGILSGDLAHAAQWEAEDGEGRRIAAPGFPAERALRGERVWPGQELLFTGDATRGPIWTRVAALPSRDAAGAIAGATVVIVDIDQEKRAVDALRDSEARMRLVQEAAGVGTWDWDIASGQVRWSEQNFRLHGLDPATAGPPTYDLWQRTVHLEDRERTHAEVAAAAERCQDFDTEYRVAFADGAARWLVGRGRVLCGADGRPERVMGINLDITARKEAEEQQALLAREVDHRAKNALAVVQSVVRLTRAERPAEFAEALEGRIAALARAHTLLAHGRWTGGGLCPLLEEELAAYLPSGRVALAGPPVTLEADAVQPLSLCLHELTTNAAKYGALSVPEGRIDIAWGLQDGALLLVWTETGGPRLAAPPERTGFGSRLLDAAVRGQLGGEAILDWRETGLVCRLRIACDRLSQVAGVGRSGPAALAAPPPVGAAVPNGLRALVAEDEPLLAMDLVGELQALGFEVVATADGIEDLQRQVDGSGPCLDLAVLDVNLSGRPSFPVADRLLARGVPVLFVTGYGELPDGPWSDHRLVRLLHKPVATADLAQAIAGLLAAGKRGAVPEPVLTSRY